MIKFNFRVDIDTMFNIGRPVEHMIDLDTYVLDATFREKNPTSEIWRATHGLCNHFYIGAPTF